MPSDPTSVQDALGSIGLGSLGLDKIKFGSGVVGKVTTSQIALLTLCVVGAVIGWRLDRPDLVYTSLCLGAAAFVFKTIAVMWFAAKNPAVALLEGGELVRYRDIEMATRDGNKVGSMINVTPPLLPKQDADAEAVLREHTVGEDAVKHSDN